MKLKKLVSLDRLIGKVDNDFNISESDWIPRAAAWVIDALSQMKCLPMEKKRRILQVDNRIAVFPCSINSTDVRVFDIRGCEISGLRVENGCKCSDLGNINPESEIAVYKDTCNNGISTLNCGHVTNNINKNFVIAGNNIELNFDTDKIVVESYEVATYYDEYYECDVPYIYDNGLLLEALSWYILFKYLSRGSKHQVYSLTSPNPVLNPYTQWVSIKNKAATSVASELNTNTDGWRNFFYNSTFDPRR